MRSSSGHKTARQELNLRFLAASLLVLLILAGAGFAWHRYQLKRVALELLDHAASRLRSGDVQAALARLEVFLDVRPGDPRGVLLMAEAMDRAYAGADNLAPVVPWYFRATAAAPDQPEVRVRLAELLLECGQPNAALQQAQQTLEDPRLGDPDGQRRARRCVILSQLAMFRQGASIRQSEMRDALESFHAEFPGDVRVAQALTHWLREDLKAAPGSELADEADAVMQRMVNASPDLPTAYLARHHYRTQFGLAGAMEDMEAALRLAPNDPTVLLAAATAHRAHRQLAAAQRYYERLIEVAPHSPDGYLGAGDVALDGGQLQSAYRLWEEGLRRADARHLDLNLRAAEALIGLGELDEAERRLAFIHQLLGQLALQGRPTQRDWGIASLHLLEGKLLLVQRDYRHAVEALERAVLSAESLVPRQPRQPNPLTPRARALLADAYALHEHWRLAAENYLRAYDLDRTRTDWALQSALAWHRAGVDERAAAVCRDLIEAEEPPPAALLLSVQLEIQRQLRLQPPLRRWQNVDAALERAEASLPDSWHIPLLRANVGALKGEDPNAASVLQLLWSLQQQHRDDAEFWKRLVITYEDLGYPKLADQALGQLDTLTHSGLEARLVRSQLWIGRGEFDAARALLEAAARVTAGDPAARRQVDELRLLLAKHSADLQEIEAVLRQWHQRDRRAIAPLRGLVELALHRRELEDASRWAAQLGALEEDDQPYRSFYEGLIWIGRAERTPTEAAESLRRAEGYLRVLSRARPQWPQTAELAAAVARSRGDVHEAVEWLAEAVRRGTQRYEVYAALIRLLYEQKRYAEAEAYFDQLQGLPPVDPAANQLAVAVNPRGFPSRHLWQAIVEPPSDAAGHLWLGQALAIAGRAREARQQLIQATESAPNDPAAWVALVSLEARTRGSDAALDLLQQLDRQSPLAPADQHFTLGYGHELLGLRQQAADHYRQALQADPQRADCHVRLATVLAAHDRQAAADHLRQAMALAPEAELPRRMLAVLLADQGPQVPWEEIQPLVSADADDLVDQRLRAVLLAKRNRLDEAIEVYQQIVLQRHATPRDRLVLAQLLEQAGRSAEAHEAYLALAEDPEAGSSDLQAALDYLLRSGDLAAASTLWQSIQRRVDLGAWSWFTLHARLLAAEGQINDVDALIERWVPDPASVSRDMLTQRYRQIGQLYESLGETKRAESWYRRLAENFPGEQETLVLHLTANQAADQALQLCIESLNERFEPQQAELLARVLLAEGIPESERMRAESLLAQAVEQFPSHAALLFSAANVHLVQHRVEQAVELLQRTTQIDPDHVLAWNNLAAILAEQPGREQEALTCIETAFQVAGYQFPTLLDTRAIVYMHLGRLDEAIATLEQVAGDGQMIDPRYPFHLAVAYWRNGQPDKARAMFQAADRAGLLSHYLTRQERDHYQRLAAQFE